MLLYGPRDFRVFSLGLSIYSAHYALEFGEFTHHVGKEVGFY